MDWKGVLVAGALAHLAACGTMTGESGVPAPPFPSPRIVDRVVVAAPKGLVEGQVVELRDVPMDAVRDLVSTVQSRCTSWSAVEGGGASYKRPGSTVNVYFESAQGRLLRLGLNKDGVVHEVAPRYAYCDWDAADYAQAVKALGLR